MPKRYTVTEIAEFICQADGLRLADHARAYSQVRNAGRRGLLQDGGVIDGRGTMAYPATEIYRARILNALADYSIDISAVADTVERALSQSAPVFEWPKRCDVGGAFQWRGLNDIIEGVRLGEAWELILHLYRPGYSDGKRISAKCIWRDIPAVERSRIESALGTGKPQATLTVDLNVLFAGLPLLDEA